MNPDDFEVTADRDGDLSLQCSNYATGCWWELPFGRPWDVQSLGSDLGSLREAAQAHIAEAHATP